MDDPGHPMLNRAIQSHFAPGSVFKVFMEAAGLESGMLNPLRSIFCGGSATFYGHTFGCDKHHGTLDLHQAIVNSCDVYFYTVGNELGIDRISTYAKMMGLGRKTGIDLPNEDGGLIPSQEWKQRVYKTKWYAGETISVAIGQGAVGVTPLQAAWAMGGLTYAGYKIVGAIVILPVLRHLTSDRDAVVSGLIAAPLAMLPALMFF